MVPEFGFTVIDGTLPVQDQQHQVRLIVKKALHGWKGLPTPAQLSRALARRAKTEQQTDPAREEKPA